MCSTAHHYTPGVCVIWILFGKSPMPILLFEKRSPFYQHWSVEQFVKRSHVVLRDNPSHAFLVGVTSIAPTSESLRSVRV